MEKEARGRLAKALELVHNAQAHLIENVSPPGDPKEVERHFLIARGMLEEAANVVGLLARMPSRSAAAGA